MNKIINNSKNKNRKINFDLIVQLYRPVTVCWDIRSVNFFSSSRPLFYNEGWWSIWKCDKNAIELKIIIFNLFITFKKKFHHILLYYAKLLMPKKLGINTLMNKNLKNKWLNELSMSDSLRCAIEVSLLLYFHFANIYIKLFNNVLPINTSSTQLLENESEMSLYAMPTTENEVCNIINQLKNKHTGLDFVPIVI